MVAVKPRESADFLSPRAKPSHQDSSETRRQSRGSSPFAEMLEKNSQQAKSKSPKESSGANPISQQKPTESNQQPRSETAESDPASQAGEDQFKASPQPESKPAENADPREETPEREPAGEERLQSEDSAPVRESASEESNQPSFAFSVTRQNATANPRPENEEPAGLKGESSENAEPAVKNGTDPASVDGSESHSRRQTFGPQQSDSNNAETSQTKSPDQAPAFGDAPQGQSVPSDAAGQKLPPEIPSAADAKPAAEVELPPSDQSRQGESSDERAGDLVTVGKQNQQQSSRFGGGASPEGGSHNSARSTALTDQVVQIGQGGTTSSTGETPQPSAQTTPEVVQTVGDAASDGPQPAAPESGPPATNQTIPRDAAGPPTRTATSGHRAEAVHAESVVDRIGSGMVQSLQGGKTIRMRMHPPELGILHIEVVSTNGALTARLDVENANAHRAILENMPQLQEMLNRTNVSVERIELNVLDSQSGLSNQSQDSNPFSAGGRQSAGNREEQSSPLGKDDLQNEDHPAEPTEIANRKADGLLLLNGIDIEV